jgi:PAS domain S-box-containing protein
MNTDSTRYRQSRWLNSLVPHRGQFILAIPVSCLLASLAAFGWLQYKTAKIEAWVEHSQQVRLEAKRLLTALVDAETGVRGYALTRRYEFLEPYNAAIAFIPNSLKELHELVTDNPSQTQRLQQIQSLVKLRLDLIDQNIKLINKKPLNAPQSSELVPHLLEGKQAMDKVRIQIGQFLAEEEKLHAQRNKRFQQQQQLTWMVLGFSAGIGMIGSFLAAYLLNRLEQKLIERDRKLRESEARYRAVVENFPNGAVFLFNSELRYLLADGLGLALIGLSKEQLEGKTLGECLPQQMCSVLEPIYHDALAGTASTIEVPYDERDYIMHVLPLRNEAGDVFAGMVVSQDITDLKRSQQELQKSNRALKTISECNQALVRATDESALLQEICRIIVEFGGYRFAWIGFAEQDEAKSVRPVAQFGDEQGYLESLQLTWSDTERGRGATGTAIRTGETCVVHNIHSDPGYLPWREAAIQRGYISSIALPLLVVSVSEARRSLEGGSLVLAQPLGALSIYAAEPHAFDEAEVKLLTELANDLAYGINALRTSAEYRRTLAALRESEQRLDSMLSSLEDVVWSVCATTNQMLYLNQAAGKIYQRSVQAFFDHPNLRIDVVHPEDREWVRRLNETLRVTDTVDMEYRILRPDGSVRWLRDRGRAIYDERGTLIRFDGIATDITVRKQAEMSLRDSEAKFRAFLESASEAIIVTNADGKIVIFNAKAKELFGYDHTEVVGHTVELLMPERFQQRHTEHRGAYREQPTKRSMSKTKNLYARRKDGTEFPIEAGLSPVPTKDGLFVLTFLTDITERKQAEEEIKRLNESLKRRAVEIETRYQQIVELAEEGIWVVDSEGNTNYVNQAMARMLGYTEEEMLGHPIYEFMDEVAQQTATSSLERRKQGLGQKHEFKLRTKDGNVVWTYMSTSPVLDENGKVLWSCSLVYNITDRKQAEEQLRQSSERISLANAELARATRLKDEFLASMSHELRTPLNAILGLSEALQEEVYGSLTPKQHRSMKTIEQSGKHLLELINDILDLSKIESGRMELQIAPVSLQHLCELSLTFVKQQAYHKTIKLNSKIAEGLGEIEVDERRIRQVLINLLSNAVKFTPEGGEVWLEVEADADGEVLQFRVIDTGIGIAPENIDKLFKPFVQLDSSLSRRYSGTGLGLALVRRIVELHGGSITLESEVGNGSRFTVTLAGKKLGKIVEGVREPEDANTLLPEIHQALIVEDSEIAAKQVARYLGELGSATYIHPCGEGAIEVAAGFKPDVIILDILLPNQSGWDVLEQLKANPATQTIPVLVVSVVDERSHALELGASEYLLKPFSRQQLQSALSKVFSGTFHPLSSKTLLVMPQRERTSPLILLAEDNEANSSTLIDYLQVQGYQVILARNGLEALQMAKQLNPDLILMDIQMPQMDGLEAIHRIHTEANLATIPIIALTALAMPGDRERCLAAGARDYLTKPVGLKKLLAIISEYTNYS